MNRCVICDGKLEYIHTPKKSNIGLQILICIVCGFVQSKKNLDDSFFQNKKNIESNKIEYLSCDSDYSEGRVGKQQMVNDAKKIIQNNISLLTKNPTVLDMSSARGHFIEYISQYSPIEITGFEQDKYMVESYIDTNKFNILNIDYRDYDKNKFFDLIYSCHTLEHYSNPIQYFEFINNHLHEDGLLLLDVPNLDVVNTGLALDDYFYDKHRTYFEKRILEYIFSLFSMEIIDEIESRSTLVLLVKKVLKIKKTELPDGNYDFNKLNIEKYLKNLNENRKNSVNVVKLINKEISRKNNNKIIFYGAGRLFDALIKYGGLPAKDIDYLIDNHLSTATDQIHGIKLFNENLLDKIQDGIIFICAKSSSNEIYENLIKNYNNKKIIKIDEYF